MTKVGTNLNKAAGTCNEPGKQFPTNLTLTVTEDAPEKGVKRATMADGQPLETKL